MKIIGWTLLGIVGVAIIIFAISNREAATIDLWPAPVSGVLPVWAILFIGIVLGFIGGATVAWLAGGKTRRKARESRRQVRQLENQVESTGQAPAIRTG